MIIRAEVMPFIGSVIIAFGLLLLLLRWRQGASRRATWIGGLLAMLLILYLLYFFRDPPRHPPLDHNVIVAAADGRVAAISQLYEGQYLQTPCLRISIFLSLFDVHVNRAPISGSATFLGYFPGRRFFTFQEKSSELNQHNKIFIAGADTRCLLCQIVGPVCRRVVYWPPHDRAVELAIGERFGMMKFGSRLDMYFPSSDIEVLVKVGDRVSAGETIIAKIKPK